MIPCTVEDAAGAAGFNPHETRGGTGGRTLRCTITSMEMGRNEPHRRLLLPAAAAIVVAILYFYATLQRYAINIPSIDDYDCALEFVTRIATAHSFHEKLLILFTTQHNEYKPMFGSAIFWLQYAIAGNLDFSVSCLLGNLSCLGVAWAVWLMFLPRVRPFALRLALFVPVALLIFQLSYAEAMDAPMAGLQHMPALAFAFGAILYLLRQTRASFALACCCLVLSTSSSTNGLLLFPIGLAILAREHRWKKLAIWTALTAGAIGVYRFHYVAPPVSKAVIPFHPSPLLSLLVFKPLYTIGVLGGVAALQNGPWLFFMGAALIAFFVYVGRLGFFRNNPAVLYSSAFMVLTAMGIAHVRLVNGLQFAGSSRYRMYGAVLASFAWAAIAERWVLRDGRTLTTPLYRSRLFAAAVVLSFLHLALAAHRGRAFLKDRAERYILGMSRYQHPEAPNAASGPLPGDFGADQEFQLRYTRRILDQSIALGVYRPEHYPPPSELGYALPAAH